MQKELAAEVKAENLTKFKCKVSCLAGDGGQDTPRKLFAMSATVNDILTANVEMLEIQDDAASAALFKSYWLHALEEAPSHYVAIVSDNHAATAKGAKEARISWVHNLP